jgi:hypothetical protein
MFKRILKWIGIFVSGLVILFVLAAVYSGYKSTQYDETAIPYIEQVIPIISEWDVDQARSYFTSKALENTSEEDFQKLFRWLSKMGKLLSLGEPQFSNVTSGATLSEGSITIVTYTVPAEYEYGEALITIRLVDLGDSFEIYYFNLSSTALMD